MSSSLKAYVEANILPLYRAFDKGHGLDHVEAVINASLQLAERCGADADMAYTIAAYHDTGMAQGRELHHLHSARRLRADQELRRWFSEEQIELMAQAVEDHRASSDHEPRSLYGRIVADADREISPERVICRCVQYGLRQAPEAGFEWHLQRVREHLQRKYASGGYIRFYLNDAGQEQQLERLRNIIADEQQLRQMVRRYYDLETKTL